MKDEEMLDKLAEKYNICIPIEHEMAATIDDYYAKLRKRFY